MTSKIQKWPLDWEKHIVLYCDLYFCDKEIEYLSRDYWNYALTDRPEHLITTHINLQFRIGEHSYLVGIGSDGIHFTCSISYRIPINDLFTGCENSYICYAGDVALLHEIAALGSYNMSAFSLIKFAESVMIEDHERRNDDGWDNDDRENDPVEPFSPTNVVEPELTFA